MKNKNLLQTSAFLCSNEVKRESPLKISIQLLDQLHPNLPRETDYLSQLQFVDTHTLLLMNVTF